MAVRRRVIALVTALFLALGVLASTTSSSAAPPTGGISGTVTDSEGDPIAGIEVTVFEVTSDGEDLFVARTVTAADGTYAFVNLYEYDDAAPEHSSLNSLIVVSRRLLQHVHDRLHPRSLGSCPVGDDLSEQCHQGQPCL